MLRRLTSFFHVPLLLFASIAMLWGCDSIGGLDEPNGPVPPLTYANSGSALMASSSLVGGTETAITTNPAQQFHPDVSGDYVVWEDWRNGNLDIYFV